MPAFPPRYVIGVTLEIAVLLCLITDKLGDEVELHDKIYQHFTNE